MKLSLGLSLGAFPHKLSYGKGITKANGETCVLYAAQFSGPSHPRTVSCQVQLLLLVCSRRHTPNML